jgi:hypothetical protein
MTGATLIVVPEVLKDQWQVLIQSSVDSKVLGFNDIYVDMSTDYLRDRLPPASTLSEFAIIVLTHKRLAVVSEYGCHYSSCIILSLN